MTKPIISFEDYLDAKSVEEARIQYSEFEQNVFRLIRESNIDLERYLIAFCAENGIKPSEAEMVVITEPNQIRYYFRKRDANENR